LTIFTISLGGPTLSGLGPSGILSSRSFLQRLAEKTNGEFMMTLTAGGLDAIYRRIREVLESEALVSVVDDGPDSFRGKLDIRSRVAVCEVKVAKQRPEALAPFRAALEGALPALPAR